MDKKPFGLTGLSGSGKTTLIAKLIDWFRQQGLRVSAIKHTHHGFDLDTPGKDSWKMREAGAQEVFLVSNRRSILMHEYRESEEHSVEQLIARLAPCDLVIVEGYKRDPLPKIEVFRPALENPPVWPGNPSVVAVASDGPVQTHLPVLDLNNTATIARFIAARLDIRLN
ncbi:MAG: molybdopterin-guanine dinucleotide biosynthesis protein B [Rhodocyclaceae bacterium]|nr:molybdopterin-guanine dinucleotide biosynthesis protein B [Rhodocyclaceae bacterium]